MLQELIGEKGFCYSHCIIQIPFLQSNTTNFVETSDSIWVAGNFSNLFILVQSMRKPFFALLKFSHMKAVISPNDEQTIIETR